MFTCFPRIVAKDSGKVKENGLRVVVEVLSKPPSLPIHSNVLIESKEPGFLKLTAWDKEPSDTLYYRRAVGAALNSLDTRSSAFREESVILEVRIREATLSQFYQALMGIYHALYDFKVDSKPPCREPTVLIDVDEHENLDNILRLAESIARGIYIAKDLANLPANILNPDTLLDVLKELYSYHSVRNLALNVIEYDDLKRRGFGGIVSVGRASSKKPRLIEIIHKPVKSDFFEYALVGKTVVFDSGGLDLKTREAMDEMKYDKSGGASVAGIMATISLMGHEGNVLGVLPVVENLPGPDAYKPRDVIRMYNGLTVEITNTDAEGRLILADALSYSIETYKPKYVVDLATLTGSVVIALGKYFAGMFGTSKYLKESIIRAGIYSGEKVWELPLSDEYGEKLRSFVADLTNSGGKEGGASIAAWFLKQFVKNTEWVHLDIAGTAWISPSEKPRPPYKQGATGWGVETISLIILKALDKLQPNENR